MEETESETSSNNGGEEKEGQVDEHFVSITSGILTRFTFEQEKKATDIVETLFNSRLHEYVIVDVRGITTWAPQAVSNKIRRAVTYPDYEYHLFTHLLFCKKYNIYFALTKEFSLTVLNKDFSEACPIQKEMRNTTYIYFNSSQDELISGGSYGTRLWQFQPSKRRTYDEIKPMSNYELVLKANYPKVGGSWVRKMDVEPSLGHLYCCSDNDIFCYNLQDGGKLLFKFDNAHSSTITGCVYSEPCQVLVSSGCDCEIKVWQFQQGLLGCLSGHSQVVTGLFLHPDDHRMIISGSPDGTVRLWSLQLMQCIYNIQVLPTEGVIWMGLSAPGQLFVASQRRVLVLSLNFLPQVWAVQRVISQKLLLSQIEEKTTRVLAFAQDSSIRFYSRRTKEHICTVLTPHSLSPLDQVVDSAYSRRHGIAYQLVNARELWVYFTRSNPACRVAVWNLGQIQIEAHRRQETDLGSVAHSHIYQKIAMTKRAVQMGTGKDPVMNCCSLCSLDTSVGLTLYTEEGEVSTLATSFVLLGLEDGRILFMDPVEKSLKYFEFRATRDPILEIRYDAISQCLMTRSQTKEFVVVRYWQIPQLSMIHEVFCPLDYTCFSRMRDTMISGHSSGHVYIHPLAVTKDPGPLAARVAGLKPTHFSSLNFKPDHNAPVVAVDACHWMGIFCSASGDGVIKLWSERRILLSEILLDKPVSACCFLNSDADLLLSMEGHLFSISHSKIVHTSAIDEESSARSTSTGVPESPILEEPSMKYDGLVKEPGPINMRNYLNPFKLTLASKFVFDEDEKSEEGEEEYSESDISEDISLTDLIGSPFESPKAGSISDISLSELEEWTRMIQGHRGSVHRGYHLPAFGWSPGPSPTVTPASPTSEATLTPEPVEEVEEDEGEIEEQKEEKKPVKKPAKATATTPVVPMAPLRPERAKLADRLAAVKVDPADMRRTAARPSTGPAATGRMKESGGRPSRKSKRPAREKKKKAVSAKAKVSSSGSGGPRRSSSATTSDTFEKPRKSLGDVQIGKGERRLSSLPGLSTPFEEKEIEGREAPKGEREERKEERETEEREDVSKPSRTPARRPGTAVSSEGSQRRMRMSFPTASVLGKADGEIETPRAEDAYRGVQEDAYKGVQEVSIKGLVPGRPPKHTAVPTDASRVRPASEGAIQDDSAPKTSKPEPQRPLTEAELLDLELSRYAHLLDQHPYYLMRAGQGAEDRDQLMVPKWDVESTRLMTRPYTEPAGLNQLRGHSRLDQRILARDVGYDSTDEDNGLDLIPLLGHGRVLSGQQKRPFTAGHLESRPGSQGVSWSESGGWEGPWTMAPPSTPEGHERFTLSEIEDAKSSDVQEEQFEVLRQIYVKLLRRYQATRPSTPSGKLLHNDGIEALRPGPRLIRHALDRVGKQLRALANLDRRKVEEEEKMDRQRNLSGHRGCALGEYSVSASPPQSRQMRSRSAGPLGRRSCDMCSQEEMSRPGTTPLDQDSIPEERSGTPYRLSASNNAKTKPTPPTRDARKLMAALRIRRSAPSIPTRGRNYILIQKVPQGEVDSDICPASVHEERLIRRRFPQFQEKWLESDGLMQPKEWMYHLKTGKSNY